ncbi:hypothetical protein Tco_0289340 [Tanacetum coccineum]
MFDEDVVDHIAKVLEMLDLIKIPNVDSHRLRMKVFPLSLADDARQWWINKGDGKITTWKELVEKFFCKFYPLSRDGEDEILEEADNWGLDPLEFISRVNSIFKNHRRVDGTTQKALLHSWINENWNKEPMNDIVSSDEEWEESDYGKPPNNTTNSSFKPCLNVQEKDDIEKVDERSQKKRKGNNYTLNKAPKSDNQNNEQHGKRVYKAEKFEAIKYSLGPNEEYIAVRSCEYNAWERNEDIIMEYLVKISKKARILKLKRRHLKITDSDILYAVSIKEDTVYSCLHFTKDHEDSKTNTPYP